MVSNMYLGNLAFWDSVKKVMLVFHFGHQLYHLSVPLCTTVTYLCYTLLKIMSLESCLRSVDCECPNFVISSNGTNKFTVAPWKHK